MQCDELNLEMLQYKSCGNVRLIVASNGAPSAAERLMNNTIWITTEEDDRYRTVCTVVPQCPTQRRGWREEEEGG